MIIVTRNFVLFCFVENLLYVQIQGGAGVTTYDRQKISKRPPQRVQPLQVQTRSQPEDVVQLLPLRRLYTEFL